MITFFTQFKNTHETKDYICSQIVTKMNIHTDFVASLQHFLQLHKKHISWQPLGNKIVIKMYKLFIAFELQGKQTMKNKMSHLQILLFNCLR